MAKKNKTEDELIGEAEKRLKELKKKGFDLKQIVRVEQLEDWNDGTKKGDIKKYNLKDAVIWETIGGVKILDTIKEPKKTKPKTITLRTSESINKKANESIELLKDPELFNRIILTELDKKIVEEYETRKVIVLCAYGGRLVENAQIASFNLMVNDDAGTGKDYITGASLELLPKQNYIKKTRISANVLNYWHNAEDEPQWTWDGKVLYLEDISETILNHDVFKVMCSSGSSATIVKDQKVLDLEVEGKPIMIITTATATPNPELTRRFVMLNLDSSIHQTKEIMKRHSLFRKKGIIPVVDENIKYAMQLLNRVKVKIEFADLIDGHFPAKNIIMRTHYPRFLDFISASCAFHQFQRKKDNEGFYLAEGKDYDLARECFLKLCSNKYMIPLTINQKKILEKFELEPLLEGSIAQLYVKMNFMSEKSLGYNLRLLSQYGILETEESTNIQNKTVTIFRLCGSYKPNEKISIPTYKEICSLTSEPTTPTTPTTTTIHTIPTKKDKKGDFLEVPKVPKWKSGSGDDINLQESRKILEDFDLK